jgi:hypothetical protein
LGVEELSHLRRERSAHLSHRESCEAEDLTQCRHFPLAPKISRMVGDTVLDAVPPSITFSVPF